MTCIVGLVDKGKVWIGGDRAAIDDGHYLFTSAEPKVFRNGPLIMGYTSSFRMGQLLEHKLKVPDLPHTKRELTRWMATEFADAVRNCLKEGGYTKTDSGRESSGTFLVGVLGKLYQFDNDHNVLQSTHGFNAVGCGVSVALGSLHSTKGVKPEKRLRLAMEAAEQFTTGVRAPFDIISE